MKQKDIALVVIVIIISGALAFVLSNTFITSSSNRKQQVEVVDAITAEFPEADSRYFNENSVNPTQLIQIGDNTNPTPFNGSD